MQRIENLLLWIEEKWELNERGLNDVKDSGGPVQDSDVVLQLYYPARDKIPRYPEYKIGTS